MDGVRIFEFEPFGNLMSSDQIVNVYPPSHLAEISSWLWGL